VTAEFAVLSCVVLSCVVLSCVVLSCVVLSCQGTRLPKSGCTTS
jgi:hypothetical protein